MQHATVEIVCWGGPSKGCKFALDTIWRAVMKLHQCRNTLLVPRLVQLDLSCVLTDESLATPDTCKIDLPNLQVIPL